MQTFFPGIGSSNSRGDIVTPFSPQKAYVTMPWVPPASNSSCSTWGMLVEVEVTAKQKAKLAMPVLAPCDGETPLTFLVPGDEELVDHEPTPKTQVLGGQNIGK